MAGTHLGPFLIWAPDSFGPHSFGPLTHLGPNTFGPQLIWAPTHLGPDSFGPQHIWAPTHLGPDSFGPQHIWAPTHLGPYSFGPLLIWAPTHLGPNSFGPRHIWAPTYFWALRYFPNFSNFFKSFKFNYKISKSRCFLSHRGISYKKSSFYMIYRYCKVGSSRPVYYSILNYFGQMSQYISIKFTLHKQSENSWICY